MAWAGNKWQKEKARPITSKVRGWQQPNLSRCSESNKQGREGTWPGLRFYLLSDLGCHWLIGSGKNKQTKNPPRFLTQRWHLKLENVRSWSSGLVVNSPGYSRRGPRFISQHPHGCSQTFVTSASSAPLLLRGHLHICGTHTYIQRDTNLHKVYSYTSE